MKRKSFSQEFTEACEAYRLHCTTTGKDYKEPFMAFTTANTLSIRLYCNENELLARYDRKQKTIVV